MTRRRWRIMVPTLPSITAKEGSMTPDEVRTAFIAAAKAWGMLRGE